MIIKVRDSSLYPHKIERLAKILYKEFGMLAKDQMKIGVFSGDWIVTFEGENK